MIFDERLTELRKETPFNQKDFANELGLEPSKYNKWENGKTVPDFETVITLAKYFNVTVDYLVGNSDVRKWENADIHEKTGLSEQAIEKIKTIDHCVSYDIQWKPHFIRLLNLILEDDSFAAFLQEMDYYFYNIVNIFELEKYLIGKSPLATDSKLLSDLSPTVDLNGYNIIHDDISISMSSVINHALSEVLGDEAIADKDFFLYKLSKNLEAFILKMLNEKYEDLKALCSLDENLERMKEECENYLELLTKIPEYKK